ncbi:hypothetical protein JOF29_003010 [Kribbella aluminosa]|uniref:Uncharacterized protein n=1 Tax=Kribbella aluminosa TaxID=416017 RepID=A0ABS4UJV5_9ACTN|nr:hypothetical protein [Kribbella aluminosa]
MRGSQKVASLWEARVVMTAGETARLKPVESWKRERARPRR